MSTVDVLTMAAPAKPVANQAKQPKSEGFARELEAATRPMTTRDSQADDNASRPTQEDKLVVETKARRAHERHESTRRTQAGAKEAANASTANDKVADHKDAASAQDAKGEDLATDDSTAAAQTAEGKADVATTDSAGPGTASSGEASQDPAVIALVVPPTAITPDVAQGADESGALAQAAIAGEPGVAAINQAGATISRSIESAAVKVTGSATPEPAASGEKVAGPVAGEAPPAAGADRQASSGGSQEQSRPGVAAPVVGADASATDARKVADAASPPAGAPTGHAVPRTAEVTVPVTGTPVQTQPTASIAPAVASSGADSSPRPTSDLPPTAVTGAPVMTVSSQAHAPVVSPAAASAPSFPVPLASQLSGQLASLRQLPQGEHVLTLTVNPETFGPVRVVAHISRDGVSLEIFGASDQARAALKAALPDLRRDLAGTGLEPKLELGAGGSGGRDFSGDASAFAREGDTQQRSTRQPFAGATSSLASPVTPPTTNATRRGGLDLVL